MTEVITAPSEAAIDLEGRKRKITEKTSSHLSVEAKCRGIRVSFLYTFVTLNTSLPGVDIKEEVYSSEMNQ